MSQGGNFWALFTPGIWKELHAVLQIWGRAGGFSIAGGKAAKMAFLRGPLINFHLRRRVLICTAPSRMPPTIWCMRWYAPDPLLIWGTPFMVLHRGSLRAAMRAVQF